MFQVILIVWMALCIHVPGVPISHFRDTLGAPMRPDPQLGVAIPFGHLVAGQRIPIRVKMDFYKFEPYHSPRSGFGSFPICPSPGLDQHLCRSGALADIQFRAQQHLLRAGQFTGHMTDQNAGSLVAHIMGREGDGG